jgi:hypothetical protein
VTARPSLTRVDWQGVRPPATILRIPAVVRAPLPLPLSERLLLSYYTEGCARWAVGEAEVLASPQVKMPISFDARAATPRYLEWHWAKPATLLFVQVTAPAQHMNYTSSASRRCQLRQLSRPRCGVFTYCTVLAKPVAFVTVA